MVWQNTILNHSTPLSVFTHIFTTLSTKVLWLTVSELRVEISSPSHLWSLLMTVKSFWNSNFSSEIVHLMLNIHYFLEKKLFSLRKSYSLTGNHFLWQEFISFERISFPLAGNHFLLQEIIYFGRNHFLWQETISFDRNPFPLTGNYFLW